MTRQQRAHASTMPVPRGASAAEPCSWRKAGSLVDGRKDATRACPHALTVDEKEQIVERCNSEEFRSLPPSQLVPRLAERGIYLVSESSFYRVLDEYDQNHRHSRSEVPRTVTKPKAGVATAPNQVWSWDITYLPTAIRGQFYRLYLVLDVYSRMIVGWGVHHDELAVHASELMSKAYLRHHIAQDKLALHRDNGGLMKGATSLAKLQALGVVSSFNRPSVSNDSPYSEATFRTLKYTPAYPKQPFAGIEEARQWIAHFVIWYNTKRRHRSVRFVTPEQRHEGRDEAIFFEGAYGCLRDRQGTHARPLKWMRHTQLDAGWHRLAQPGQRAPSITRDHAARSMKKADNSVRKHQADSIRHTLAELIYYAF